MGQDSLEVIKVLDVISKDTSLVRCEGELYRFDHGRTRDAIYDDISLALKRMYHGKVAEKLENASMNGKLPFSDLAYQYAQAGNKEKAIKYALLSRAGCACEMEQRRSHQTLFLCSANNRTKPHAKR